MNRRDIINPSSLNKGRFKPKKGIEAQSPYDLLDKRPVLLSTDKKNRPLASIAGRKKGELYRTVMYYLILFMYYIIASRW